LFVPLSGRGSAGTPDLTISNLTWTAPAGDPAWSYTVTVQNIGTGTANVNNAAVQGYYTSSTDTTVFPPPGGASQTAGGDPACGSALTTSLAPGASIDVVVTCSSGPTASTDTNLMVGVDVTNVLAESNETNNVAVVAIPPAFTVSPTSYDFGSVLVGSGAFTYVNVTTGNNPIVIENPSEFNPDTVVNGTHIFGDTQGGSCWQTYQVHGNPIPAHTTCDIAVAFHPQDAIAYATTMTVYQCATTQVFQNGNDQSITCQTTEPTGVNVALSGTGTAT